MDFNGDNGNYDDGFISCMLILLSPMDSRFTIEKRDGSARSGRLVLHCTQSSNKNTIDRILETPALLVHTTRGSSPNLTGDMLEGLGKVAGGNFGLQVDLLQLYVIIYI